jgi:hypothetical protein
MIAFAEKVPILKIIDKRCACDKSPSMSVKKQRTGRSKTDIKCEDDLLISKLRSGEEVERNVRQQKHLEEMCNGKHAIYYMYIVYIGYIVMMSVIVSSFPLETESL